MLITVLIIMLFSAHSRADVPGSQTGFTSVGVELSQTLQGLSIRTDQRRDLRTEAISDRLADAVKKQLQAVYPLETYRFEVVMKHVPATLRNVHPGSDFEVIFTSASPKGYEIAMVTEKSGPDKPVSERIQVHISLQAKVPVTTRTITAGDRIGADDLKTVWKDITRYNETVQTDAGAILGTSATRRILRDSPILYSHIRHHDNLQAGFRLQMLYQENGLSIELPVVLRQEAAPGQTARAFHHATGRHFEVRITDNQHAQWLRTL